mgnify:CR=1 FL=1
MQQSETNFLDTKYNELKMKESELDKKLNEYRIKEVDGEILRDKSNSLKQSS